ncbi:hypothetical protein IP69_12910 [Bosea sp. AAP35]|uniref:hypothetical protein n=1 Tax=Bosea sp. AAP35 TaxID=1523417 RepID=UPI0006B9D2A6|nr:hypothetical protein [Bosea sp. AAP35]KPF67603.1 hypothetical protein IP69_12910 [Bosea sp. AAP35]
MSASLTGQFDTRRDAEMAVERLVQEHGIERADIVVAPVGAANTAGEHAAGSDRATAEPSTQGRQDAALNGLIQVSVDVADETLAGVIRKSFAEFDAENVVQDR